MFIDIFNFPASGIQCLTELMEAGYEAFFVGGCVRDLVMGNVPHDFDICTNALPDEVIAILNEHNRRVIETGLKHGTVTGVYGEDFYEITTYRADGDYQNHRSPEFVVFQETIHEDLARRDFTINAMAYNPLTDEFVDLFGGIEDIKNKVIRAVGKPTERFTEDALRILRALRFAIRYEFSIEHETACAMIGLRDLLDVVSKERKTQELKKMLTCGKPIAMLFAEFVQVITQILPELKPCIGFEQHNKYHRHQVFSHMLHVVDFCKSDKFEIKLAALLHDIGKPDAFVIGDDGYGHFYGHPETSYKIAQELLQKHLRLSNDEETLVLNLIRYHDMHIPETMKAVRKALRNHGEAFLRDFFILKQADMDDHIYPKVNSQHPSTIQPIAELMEQILSEEACFSLKDLAVNGSDIMEYLHLKPSKRVGEILNTLLDAVIEDKVKNEKDKLLKFVEEI